MSILKAFWSTLRPPHEERLLWERRWHDETVQVWEKLGCRELRFSNHIIQSALTLANPDHLVLRYPQHMMLALLLRPQPQRVLHLGLGAGSLPTFLHRSFPKLQQVVIELIPEVAEAAHLFFNLPQDSRLEVRIADAYEAIPDLTEDFDLICLDTFNASGAPERMNSEALLSTLRERLDLKVYVDTDADIRLLRRLERDVKERGRDISSVAEQYRSTVRPMHAAHVEDCKSHADVIVPGEGDLDRAVEVIAAYFA